MDKVKWYAREVTAVAVAFDDGACTRLPSNKQRPHTSREPRVFTPSSRAWPSSDRYTLWCYRPVNHDCHHHHRQPRVKINIVTIIWEWQWWRDLSFDSELCLESIRPWRGAEKTPTVSHWSGSWPASMLSCGAHEGPRCRGYCWGSRGAHEVAQFMTLGQWVYEVAKLEAMVGGRWCCYLLVFLAAFDVCYKFVVV